MTRDTEVCTGAGSHAPLPLWTERHHIFPTYLCDLLGVEERDEVLPLCGNCHERVHHAIRHLVNTGENPHRLSVRETSLVQAAWSWWQQTLAGVRP